MVLSKTHEKSSQTLPNLYKLSSVVMPTTVYYHIEQKKKKKR